MTRYFKLEKRRRLFARKENGSLSVEAVLVFPFMVWVVLGLFTITDVFRALHLNVMSTHSIGDILSRQTDYIDPDDIEGLNALHEVVAHSDGETDLRVTMILFDTDVGGYQVQWSYATADQVAITDATFAEIAQRVPVLNDGDGVVLVETWTGYVPMVSYLVDDMEFYQAVATRPRFAPTLAWAG